MNEKMQKFVLKTPNKEESTNIKGNKELEPELEKSKKIAEDKLNRIMGKFFYNYVIRAMNLNEFEEIVKNNSLAGNKQESISLTGNKEVYMPNHYFDYEKKVKLDRYVSFSEYLKEDRRNVRYYESMHEPEKSEMETLRQQGSWYDKIGMQTLWESALGEIKNYHILLDKVRKIADQVRTEKSLEKRRAIIEGIKKELIPVYLLKFAKSLQASKKQYEMRSETMKNLEMEDKDIAYVERILNIQSESNPQFYMLRRFNFDELPSREKIKYQRRTLEEETIEVFLQQIARYKAHEISIGQNIIGDLINLGRDGGWIYESGNVKKLFHILVRLDDKGSSIFSDGYQIAVAIDGSAISGPDPEPGRNWGLVGQDNKGDKILSAIALHGDPILVEKLVELSSHGGETACPVFTANGTIKFPK